MKMDLNSDLGESFSAWRMGDDAAMLGIVSSANVACGFHAGDAAGILRTLRDAQARGVVVPDSFTHGSSAQRVRWFQRGLESGEVAACNTFDAKNL